MPVHSYFQFICSQFTQLQQHGDLFALAFRLLCLESNSVFIYHQSQSLKLGKLQSYSFGDAWGHARMVKRRNKTSTQGNGHLGKHRLKGREKRSSQIGWRILEMKISIEIDFSAVDIRTQLWEGARFYLWIREFYSHFSLEFHIYPHMATWVPNSANKIFYGNA